MAMLCIKNNIYIYIYYKNDELQIHCIKFVNFDFS